MNKATINIENVGWHFDNTYSRLPEVMRSKIKPVPVKKPSMVLLNHELSKDLALIKVSEIKGKPLIVLINNGKF